MLPWLQFYYCKCYHSYNDINVIYNLERNLNNGSLYKLDKNLLLTKVDKNYMITNGPAFINPYNFYHTDSRKKVIYKIKIGKN